jgi:hypothetical protein
VKERKKEERDGWMKPWNDEIKKSNSPYGQIA